MADLPKIADLLAEELKNPPQLKPTETEEKIHFPSADGKVLNFSCRNIINFFMNFLEIKEQKEKSEFLKTIETFDAKNNLKHTETLEKVHFPTKEELEQEKSNTQS